VAGWEVPPPKKRPFRGSKRFIRIESQYYYDPFGRRLWKEVNEVRTYFVYADEGLIAEADAAGNVVKSYGYRPGSTWTTDPLFMTVGGQYYFYQNDHLGTPQKLTAVNGAVVWSAKYSSFGEAVVDISSPITNNLRFPGQYFDQETGQHFNWHRYYSPVAGRYLIPDPIGFQDRSSLYVYVENSPLNFIDPKGLSSIAPGVPGYDPGRELDRYFKKIYDLFKKEAAEEYCGSISRCIGVSADLAAIGAQLATLSTAGAASPVTASVAVTARVVSFANGVATIKICGPKTGLKPSMATSTAGALIPGWWGAAVSAVDGILTAAGN
jgi:RHS repeat-associated protein